MLKMYLLRFRYWLESVAFAGLPAQILTFIGIIFLLSVLLGGCLFILTDDFHGLTGFVEAIWWAFLRLSDPGYLGDDHGIIKRTISTLLMIMGYVFFLGSFVALMTQYMFRALREMENGTTPLFLNDHILILGLNSKTQILVEGILKSSVHKKDFHQRTEVQQISIVILCEKLDAQIFYRFKQSMGELWGSNIHLRGGNPLNLEDLHRVNFLKASSIIMPSFEQHNIDSDARQIKTLLTIISSIPNAEEDEAIPPIVIEMLSRKKAHIARSLYSKNVEIICTDTLLSRIVAQNVRHTGLVHVYSELLRRHYGNSIYVQRYPQLIGHPYTHAKRSFPRSIVLGILKTIGHRHIPHLNPELGTVIEEFDQIVLIAKRPEDLVCEIPEAAICNIPIKNVATVELPAVRRKVLILGWNQQVVSVIQTFGGYKNEVFDVMSVSRLDPSERKKKLSKIDYDPQKIQIEFVHGDYNGQNKIRSIRPETFSDIIMFSTESTQSQQDSDARTLVGHLMLNDYLREFKYRPDILVEIVDHQNEKLFIKHKDEVLVAPLILAHMLGQVALKPEINEIYEDLLDTTEHEISIQPVTYFSLGKQMLTVAEIEDRVASAGLTFLGYIKVSINGKTKRDYFINPAKDDTYQVSDLDEVIFLT